MMFQEEKKRFSLYQNMFTLFDLVLTVAVPFLLKGEGHSVLRISYINLVGPSMCFVINICIKDF